MSDSDRGGLRASYRALEARVKRRAVLFEGSELLVSIGKALTLVAVILSLIPLSFSLFLGYSFNSVLTPSMAPTLKVGSVAVTAPYLGEELTRGTIFGFQTDSGEKVLHRVERVVAEGDEISYISKGDGNGTVDIVPVLPENIWGVGVNVLDGPLAYFIGNFSWNGTWAAQSWSALTAGDFGAFFALLPNASWGAFLLLGLVVLFWWILPLFLVSLGNRLVRSDEEERRRLERELELLPKDAVEEEELAR